jgi:hypothetical protein
MTSLALFCSLSEYQKALQEKLASLGFHVLCLNTDSDFASIPKDCKVFVLDFSGSVKEFKNTLEKGKGLAHSFRNANFYILGVENHQKESVKVRIPKGKFIEEKALYRMIKPHIEENSSTTTPPSAQPPTPSCENQKTPEPESSEPSKKQDVNSTPPSSSVTETQADPPVVTSSPKKNTKAPKEESPPASSSQSKEKVKNKPEAVSEKKTPEPEASPPSKPAVKSNAKASSSSGRSRKK